MARFTRKYNVTIGDKSTTVHTENRGEAINRAVTKLFGSRCFWFADSGVPGYGQVFESLKPTKRNSNPGNSSVTSRVGINVVSVGTPSRNFLRQQKNDQTENQQFAAEEERRREREYRAYDAGQSGLEFPDDLRNGDDSLWLEEKYNNGKWDAAEFVREQQNRIDAEAAQRQADEDRERQEYLDQQHDLALTEHRERMARARSIADRVAYIRTLSWDELLNNSLVETIIRNTIAPASFERIGRGRMSLGDFKRGMLGGQYMAEILSYINSENIYKRLENIEL